MEPDWSTEVQQQHLCGICLEVLFDPASLKNCKHIFCIHCIENSYQKAKNKICPLCRGQYKTSDIKPQIQLRDLMRIKYPRQIDLRKINLKKKNNIELQIGSTFKQLKEKIQNKNQYQWTFFIKPALSQKATMKEMIYKCEVNLHPSFRPSKLEFKSQDFNQTNSIKITRIGWGVFPIKTKVYWTRMCGGGTSQLIHDLSFVKQNNSKIAKIKCGQF